jgi:hypothetical protein
MLDEMGIPVCAERSPCGGYKMPPLVLTPDKVFAVGLLIAAV